MSQPPSFPPTRNPNYSPLLPSQSRDIGLDEVPPSPRTPNLPSPRNSFHTPLSQAQDLQADDYNPYGDTHPYGNTHPYGGSQPRFLGRAMYEEVGGPAPLRQSFASSQHTLTSVNNDPRSSIYGRPSQSGFYGSYRDQPSASFVGSEQALPLSPMGRPRYYEEKRPAYAPPKASRRKLILWSLLGALLLILIGAGVGVYFGVFVKAGRKGGSTSAPAQSSGGTKPKGAITGGDGTLITMDDGTTFTYSNKFGGYWYDDPNDPLNNGAQAQSYTPALNQTFQYGIDKIHGVNLGGWLTLEPFITPALFEKYLNNPTPAVDEWTLSQAMAADTAGGGLTQLEDHYKTFITEQDFAQIAGAGLNFVRIPLPYWAIETRAGEPFLANTSWTYFLKAIKWARKYGLRINLDLHALPGSQNGWNHSGRLGTVNMLNGPMGVANAQRSLDYIRVLAEFISQPQYKDVVALFGITNEPQAPVIGQDALSRYYLQAYQNVRLASGIGQGNGPVVSLHDGFLGLPQWAGFLPNADRIALDFHPYLCFGAQSNAPISTYSTTPCTTWGALMNTSMSAFGFTAAGEWSNANTDCGLWVNGVNLGTRYDGTYVPDNGARKAVGSCTQWTDWQNYDQLTKDGIQNFALASMDALQNWFFWTWKIGNSSVTGKVESPAWSYQLGLENGWMPKDPRVAAGHCAPSSPWQPPLAPYQTGGAGAGNIPPAVTASLAWPPPVISGGGALAVLPTYTATGPIPTLPAPTSTAAGATATVDFGDGWANPADTAGMAVGVVGCSYLDPWVGAAAPPSPLCPGSRRREPDAAPAPFITPPPSRL